MPENLEVTKGETDDGNFAYEAAERWINNGVTDPNDNAELKLSSMYQREADFQQLVGIKNDTVKKEYLDEKNQYYFLKYQTVHPGIIYQEYWLNGNKNNSPARLSKSLVRE